MQINRRRMLALSLGGGAVLATGFAGQSALQRLSAWPTPREFTRHGLGLGTKVSMTVLANSSKAAEQALDAAFAEIETVEQVMSLYRPDSQICQLNRDRILRQPHPYLCEVLTTAASISELSGGAFDVTVQPLWDLRSTHRQRKSAPTPQEIDATRSTIRWQSVEVDHELVRFNTPVESITLNGIAQGFAADRALTALRRHGIEHALINAGEISSLGEKSNDHPWVTGIQHPRDPDAYAAVIPLDGRSLATSGDYATSFSADFSQNHIFDPRTGDSPQELASVTIAAASGVLADGLSTAAMVLGAEQTLALVRQIPDVDAFLVLKSGQTLRTTGFPSDVTIDS